MRSRAASAAFVPEAKSHGSSTRPGGVSERACGSSAREMRKVSFARHVQPVFDDHEPAGHPRTGQGDARRCGQPAVVAGHLPRSASARCIDRFGRRARAGARTLGHAVARLRAGWPQGRSRRHQRAQHRQPALASVACASLAMPRSVHVLQRKRSPGRRKSEPIWFALDSTRPLAFFAGIWTRWTCIRKTARAW